MDIVLVDRMINDDAASVLVQQAEKEPERTFDLIRGLHLNPTDRFFAFLDQIEGYAIGSNGGLRYSYRQFLSSLPDRIISDIILRLGIPQTASLYLREVSTERFDNILLLSLKHSDLGVRNFGDENDRGIRNWERIIQRLAQLCCERAVTRGLEQGAAPERWVIIQNASLILRGGPLPEVEQEEQKWLSESLDLNRFDEDLSLVILWRLMTRHPHISFYLELLPQLFGGLKKLSVTQSSRANLYLNLVTRANNDQKRIEIGKSKMA